MQIIGQNYSLRKLPSGDWGVVADNVRNALTRIDGVGLISMSPGLMSLEVEGRNARDVGRTLDLIKSRLPDWRFSEGGEYELPAPVGMKVLI